MPGELDPSKEIKGGFVDDIVVSWMQYDEILVFVVFIFSEV